MSIGYEVRYPNMGTKTLYVWQIITPVHIRALMLNSGSSVLPVLHARYSTCATVNKVEGSVVGEPRSEEREYHLAIHSKYERKLRDGGEAF